MNVIKNINKFIERIGKINFILLVFVISMIVVIGLYGTLAADTSDNYSLVAKTYKFIVGDKSSNEVIIASGEDKYMDITISNPEKIDLKYAIYYNTTDTDFEIGYIKETLYPTSGVVKANSEVVVSIYVRNNSTSDITIELGVDYGTVNGGDISVSGTRIENEIMTPVIASEYIMNLYNDGTSITTVNIGGDTSNPTVSLNDTQGIMLDNNGDYRYYGASPNNYVLFNDELWRIVSVSDVEDGNGDIQPRVKIIKNDSVGDFSYDNKTSGLGTSATNNGSNNWTDSRVMMLLNPGYETVSDLYDYEGSLYWNQKSGTCYAGTTDDYQATISCDFTSTSTTKGLGADAKNMIDTTKFYLGGATLRENLYADDYYNFERGTEVYSGHDNSWIGYVGLIYPSDYSYAADLSVCTKVGWSSSGSDYDYRNTSCYDNNWLYSGYNYWTVTPMAGSSFLTYHGLYIYSYGMLYINDVWLSAGVRPVVYLKSDVSIIGGSGTEIDPYLVDLF